MSYNTINLLIIDPRVVHYKCVKSENFPTAFEKNLKNIQKTVNDE